MTVGFNSISSDVMVPLFYAEIDNSKANTAQTSGASLLIAQPLANATIERNTPVLMPGADQARRLCGRGSPLARMVDAYRKTDPFGELYVIATVDADDSKAATGQIEISGQALATGTISLYVGAVRVQSVVSLDDTAMQVAEALVQSLKSVSDLAFTAKAEALATEDSDTAALITLTAKYPGVTANGFPLALNYYGATGGEEVPDGLNIKIQPVAGGAGSVQLEAAIAGMGDEPYDYIGLPFNDPVSLIAMNTEMDNSSGRWSWTRMLYGHVYTARIAAFSDLINFGGIWNSEHLTVCGYEPSTQTPVDEIIAARLGRQAAFLRNDPARPTQTGDITGVLPAPKGRRFLTTERQSLLARGIATATVNGGVLQIERDVTTYKQNKYGVTDNSYLDSETLHTSAYVIRRLKSVITSKYPRHKLADDGTRYGAGQAIVTPSVIKGELCAAYKAMERAGIVENFEVFKKNLIVERNANNPNRVDVLFPPDYVNQLRIFALVNQFRLQYSDEEISA